MHSYHATRLLTAEEEIELARRVHYGQADDALAARNELVLSNLGLVGAAAARYARRYRADYDDLFAEGAVALVRAAEGYDPDAYPARFSTYAVPAIRREIRESVLLNRSVHVPLYLQQPGQLKKARARVADWPRQRAYLERNVLHAEAAILPFASLSPESKDDSPHDVPDSCLSPLEVLIQHETAERITIALGELRPLRAYVIAHRHGLCGVQEKTLQEVGRELGCSREWVRLIEVKATEDLRRVLHRDHRACA